MSDSFTPRPGVTLDLSGVSCPGPIIGAKKIVMELAEGEVMLLISDCPATSDELHTWAERTGNQVVKTERLDSGSTGYYVRRGRRTELAPNVFLDMRGSTCPGPILEAKKVLNGMAPGELLKLVSNCPGVGADIADWVKVTGFALLATEEIAPGSFAFTIRKP